jgi:hypothetical protein
MILGCFGPGSISRSRGSDFLLGHRVWFGWLRAQVADEPFVSGDDGAPAIAGTSADSDCPWPAARQGVVALLKRYPDREFFTPAVFPEKFGVEIFAPLGFAREALTQFLMRDNLQVRLFPAWDRLEHKLPYSAFTSV